MPSEDLLAKYADVAVRVGIGLEEGDRLLIRSSVEALDLTRLIVEQAYAAGAVNVDVLWADDASSRARFSHGSADAAEAISSASNFLLKAYELGDQIMSVSASDPAAMAGQDVAKIGQYQRINGEFLDPVFKAMGAMQVKWSIIAAASPAWAAKVFPDAPEDDAVESLWDAIFRACRIDADDPVESWREHLANLRSRANYLSGREYTGLRYEGPGTDLTMGLPEGALWEGGSVTSPSGRTFAPNIPTEEVFTIPHRLKVDGIVRATKPLSLFGNLVVELSFEVSDGVVVGATAAQGQDVLDELLATDPGSVRMGEAAMVPQSSAVAREGLVWSQTLYDENDACHIAIGRAYPTCVQGGVDMSREEQEQAGINHSSVHVDFVVGSDQLNVFGLTEDGREEAIIANGEWAFDA
jgi:aminopeptidase